MKRVGLVLGLIGVSLGCGGDAKAPYVRPHRPTDVRDASIDEEVVDAGDGGMLVQNGPVVEITTPQPAADPDDDTVITSRDITVRCKVKPREGGADVERGSVKISLTNKENTTVVGAIDQLPDDEYQAKFDLSTLPNGALHFRCEAKDTTSKTSATKIDSLLDLGPTIEVFDPKDNGVYALNSPVVIQFQVHADPLTGDDEESEVTSVKLEVSGMDIPLTETEGKPGLYQTSVDFGKKELFKVPPTSAEVLFKATNRRTPQAVTRSVKADIGIDGVGPKIKVESPAYNSIGHGEVELVVTVTDDAGVAPRSLKAEINGGLLTITDWEVMGSTYRQTFDTRKFDRELVQLTINLTASDVVGNQTLPVSHILNLDNLPPVISLDPPNIREWKKVGENYYCGEEFDPVGSDAISDGDPALDASLYRVLVEDRVIYAPGANIAYYAGVDRTSVVLYAQPDTNVPLLFDSNGDGDCDEINYLDLPAQQQPVKVSLAPATSRGASWFPKPVAVDFDTATHMAPSCVADPNGADNPPNTLCPSTSMTRVVAGRGADKPPAVYGLNPSNGTTLACEGMTWQVLPIVGEGWACLAARATDTKGNIGISEAIRVCFDKSGTGSACPGAPPNCNKDNCKITDAQRFGRNEVWQQR